MMLRTTINMDKTIYSKIDMAAKKLKKSKRSIVIMLLTRVRHNINSYPGDFSLVKYQSRVQGGDWHCFTIVFKKQENEIVSDFRRLGKLSVSFFVKKATEEYLYELLEEGGNSHNYVELDCYAIGERRENGIICWEFYWGAPQQTEKSQRTTIQRLLHHNPKSRRPFPSKK